MPSPRLPLINRVRVLTRRVLHRGLTVIPDRAVEWTHDRWVSASGVRRTLLRPVACLLFYRALNLPSFTVPDGRGERLHVTGSRMERELYWFGEEGYEPSEAHWWRTLCARSHDVLEIGANIGFYTVVGATATSARYTTVEANPEAAAIVRRNLGLNRLDHVEVVEGAVVGDPAPSEIELAFPDQEAHSVAPTGSWIPSSSEGRQWVPASVRTFVPTVPAASLFEGRDLVKIDIEGAEAEVLTAAWAHVESGRPVLVVELLPESQRLQFLLGTLLDQGYLAFEMARVPRPLQRSELDRSGVDPRELVTVTTLARDVLMVPAERADVLI